MVAVAIARMQLWQENANVCDDLLAAEYLSQARCRVETPLLAMTAGRVDDGGASGNCAKQFAEIQYQFAPSCWF